VGFGDRRLPYLLSTWTRDLILSKHFCLGLLQIVGRLTHWEILTNERFIASLGKWKPRRKPTKLNVLKINFTAEVDFSAQGVGSKNINTIIIDKAVLSTSCNFVCGFPWRSGAIQKGAGN
jgi:hypothetical protein